MNLIGFLLQCAGITWSGDAGEIGLSDIAKFGGRVERLPPLFRFFDLPPYPRPRGWAGFFLPRSHDGGVCRNIATNFLKLYGKNHVGGHKRRRFCNRLHEDTVLVNTCGEGTGGE